VTVNAVAGAPSTMTRATACQMWIPRRRRDDSLDFVG
jgi:hypothetical protein